MKINKSKYVDIIIILALIIVLIILILVVVNKATTTNTTKPIENTKDDGLLNLSGLGVFFEEYTGDFKASDVAKKVEDLTTIYIPELMNTLSNTNEIQQIKYFYENQKNIKEVYGIKEYNEFINFIEKIEEKNIDVNNWYRLDMDTETFINDSEKNGYSYIEYYVSMKNDEKIYFSLYVAKSSKNTIPYIINVLEK